MKTGTILTRTIADCGIYKAMFYNVTLTLIILQMSLTLMIWLPFLAMFFISMIHTECHMLNVTQLWTQFYL